jgi:hypothetical protein
MDIDTSRADDVAEAYKGLLDGGGGGGAAETPEVVSSSPSEGSTDSTSTATEATETTSTAAQRARDETGRFTKAQKEARAASSTKAPEATPGTTTATKAPEATTQATTASTAPAAAQAPTSTEALKPPDSWKPAAREAWAKVPAEVQQEVMRREREAKVAIQQHAEKARMADSFQQVVSPYVGFIQAEGGDVLGAVGNLLQTAVALRTAPPAVKGQLLAQMIDQFGVDLDHINAAWEGRPVKDSTSSTFDPRSFAQQVRQEVMRDLQAERQKVYVAKAQQQLEEFQSKNEFFDDVREDVADMLEVASRRGLKLSLEDAYNRACAIHPDVSKVLAQRKEAQQANADQASTQQSLRASSSVRSEPSAVVATPEPQSLRGDIQSVIAELRGRR